MILKIILKMIFFPDAKIVVENLENESQYKELIMGGGGTRL